MPKQEQEYDPEGSLQANDMMQHQTENFEKPDIKLDSNCQLTTYMNLKSALGWFFALELSC